MRINWTIPIVNNKYVKLGANCSYNANRVKDGNPLSGLRVNLNATNKKGLFTGRKPKKVPAEAE